MKKKEKGKNLKKKKNLLKTIDMKQVYSFKNN